jgi:hypothetical protein
MMSGLRPTRPLSQWTLDEVLQWGVEAAEEQLNCGDAATPGGSHQAGKRARAAVSGKTREVPQSEEADARPFVLFAKAKRPRERVADTLHAPRAPPEEEPNAAHVVVSDPAGLVPLSEDAPFKSLGLNDWLVREHACTPYLPAHR